MQNKATIAAIALATFALASCGHRPAPVSVTKGADDLVTLDVTDARRADIVHLVAALAKAESDGSELKLVDLTQIVELAPSDRDAFRVAYPDALKVACADGVCTATGAGSAAKVAVVASTESLTGISVGVKAELMASFKVLAARTSVRLCDIGGVYFAKAIARKNLKALEINLTPVGGTVRVWLAGADDIPTCE